MAERVYLETTIVSYLAARRSRDLLVAAHQQITEVWWESHRTGYDLFVSELVFREAAAGDPDVAAKRLLLLQGIASLAITDSSTVLARVIIDSGLLFPAAADDALHLAIATTSAVDYLLTWNCTHIANAFIIRRLQPLVSTLGYRLPVICTPEELLGGNHA